VFSRDSAFKQKQFICLLDQIRSELLYYSVQSEAIVILFSIATVSTRQRLEES